MLSSFSHQVEFPSNLLRVAMRCDCEVAASVEESAANVVFDLRNYRGEEGYANKRF